MKDASSVRDKTTTYNKDTRDQVYQSGVDIIPGFDAAPFSSSSFTLHSKVYRHNSNSMQLITVCININK